MPKSDTCLIIATTDGLKTDKSHIHNRFIHSYLSTAACSPAHHSRSPSHHSVRRVTNMLWAATESSVTFLPWTWAAARNTRLCQTMFVKIAHHLNVGRLEMWDTLCWPSTLNHLNGNGANSICWQISWDVTESSGKFPLSGRCTTNYINNNPSRVSLNKTNGINNICAICESVWINQRRDNVLVRIM